MTVELSPTAINLPLDEDHRTERKAIPAGAPLIPEVVHVSPSELVTMLAAFPTATHVPVL
jgi:hypothetical protein